MIVPARTPEERQFLVSYIAAKLKLTPQDLIGQMPFEVMVVMGKCGPIGAVLYTDYRTDDIQITCAGEPGWVSRRTLRQAFAYPFEQLNCRRVTCVAHRKNKYMRSYLLRMGFQLEGVKRKALNGSDLMIYGLLKEEQKWA